jgi:hypothetical protein
MICHNLMRFIILKNVINSKDGDTSFENHLLKQKFWMFSNFPHTSDQLYMNCIKVELVTLLYFKQANSHMQMLCNL